MEVLPFPFVRLKRLRCLQMRILTSNMADLQMFTYSDLQKSGVAQLRRWRKNDTTRRMQLS